MASRLHLSWMASSSVPTPFSARLFTALVRRSSLPAASRSPRRHLTGHHASRVVGQRGRGSLSEQDTAEERDGHGRGRGRGHGVDIDEAE